MDKMFDLSKMPINALEEAIEILTAYKNTGLPVDFYDEGVALAYNEYSDMVFLTNNDYQVAVYNEYTDELDSWYYLPWSGFEGTLSDLLELLDDDLEEEDLIYLKDLCEDNNEFDKAAEISEMLGSNEEEAE